MNGTVLVLLDVFFIIFFICLPLDAYS
uniref:Uncharacterized protein n=1 Tax=Anguilla anguilla TaxID=7936 RepID=A0A0E9R6M3_ANGAN